MSIPGAILRLIVVTLISVLWSVLALSAVRLTGIDIKDIKQRTRPGVMGIALFFNLLFILSVAIILRFWDHESLGVLGFTLGIRGWLFVISGLFFSVAFAFFYVRLLHSANIVQISHKPRNPGRQGMWGTMLLGFLVLFVAALQEEILFRGYFSFILLPYGFWYAIIISAVVFTLWHFLTNKAGFYQAADWLMGGIMLFYIYRISGSIWIATGIHFSRNITNILVFNITGSNALVWYDKPVKPGYKSIYTILFSILIMLAGYLVFR